jgi:hypothetical protein
MVRDRFWWTLYAIGVITVANGILQCAIPELLLSVPSLEVNVASRHFLMMTGVFTAMFGAVLVHALIAQSPQHVALLWTGIQKLTTAAAVGLAIQNRILSPLSLASAGFDLVAGVMIIAFWFWTKQEANESRTD